MIKPLVIIVIFAFIVGLMTNCRGATVIMPTKLVPVSDRFFDALWAQESSRVMNPKDGDNGKAIGPFQIWAVYWKDAHYFFPSMGGNYEKCRNLEYSKVVVTAYLNRYCKEAVRHNDFKTMARIHNGGPHGNKKDSTMKYWEQFRRHLYLVHYK